MPLELTNCLEGHSDRVWNVSWHHQGNLIASCGGDNESIADIIGKEPGVLPDAQFIYLSWSPCGNFLAAASFDATVSVWDRKSGEFECVATLEGHENEVKSVSWSSDGAYLATCSRDKSVWIWEVEDEDYECASVLSKHSQDVKKVLWHPSANILASCSYDDTINMYKEEDDDWTCFSTLTGHSSTVWSIAFDATGERLVSCSDDNTLKIWQCYYPGNMEGVQTLGREPTWKSVCSLSGYHSRTIYDVDWSHQSGLIASASGDDSVKIFQEDRVAGNKGEPIFNVVDTIERAHAQDLNCVKWSPADGSVLATCSDDSTIKLWKLVL